MEQEEGFHRPGISPQYDLPELQGPDSGTLQADKSASLRQAELTERSEKSFGSLRNPAQRGPDDLHRENGEPSRVEISSLISRRGGLSKYF